MTLKYTWEDYQEKYRATVESWLDSEARHGLGIDGSWQQYYDYWLSDELTKLGENFWCKVILNGSEPIAAIAVFLSESAATLYVSEFVVACGNRGHGIGSRILSEFLAYSKFIIGVNADEAEALIYLDNVPSERAFIKAGFEYSHTHPDGDARIYKYCKK